MERFASGRGPSFPNAALSVVFTTASVTWSLDGQFARVDSMTRRCEVPAKQRKLPEPQILKITPVEVPAPPEPEIKPPPPPEKTAQPDKAKPRKKKKRKRRARRKRSKKDAPPKKAVASKEPAPLTLKNVSLTGSIKVRRGRDDSFGDPSSKRKEPAAPEAPEPSEGTPKGEGGGGKGPPKIKIARILKSFPGKYPVGAPKLGRTVVVRLRVYVGKTGKVTKVRIVRGAGKLFNAEARRVGFKLRFKPSTINGKARGMWMPWSVEFRPPR